MPISGSIVPRYYDSSPAADAPYPTNVNTSGDGLEPGEIFICNRTGRMWMIGTVSPFYIPLALHYQFTNSGATTTNAHIRRKNVGASGSEVAAFELAGAVALTDLVSKVALGTDSYGKIVAATLSSATLLGRRGGASGEVEQITLGNGLKISSGASPAISVDGSVIPASSTSMLAGTGLTGGGDLSTDRTFSVDFAASGVSSSTKAVRADDSRLSDARTPTAHVHSAADVTSGTLDIARIPTGTSSSTVCIGNDARLSDARTPTSHTHALTDLTQTGAEKYMVPHWNGTNWTPIDYFGSTQRIMCQSEMNAAEAFTVYSSGTGSANAFNIQGIAFDGRFGILRSGTGTTNAGRAGIGSANDLDAIQLGTYATEMTAIVYLGNTSTSTERFTAIVGFTDSRLGTATDGVYFTYTDNVNSGKWECNVISNSVGVSVDSGITMTSTTWYKMRIVINAAATESKFYINDSLVATMTNTHPSGSTRRTALAAGLFKQVGTTNREMYIDYMNFIQDVLR